MSANYYSDLREFIEVLDHQGLLYRWQRPVNKDTELMPLMRLQYRGRADAERQAFLFENVTDGRERRYGIRVLTGVYAASRKIVGLGMGCEEPGDIYERWRHAVDRPIDPVTIENGPVQEEVILRVRDRSQGKWIWV
jgi:4-hydroxy-3-polyprenylbenzoate decarboxylase